MKWWKLSSAHCKEGRSSSKGRHAKMHVSHSLTSYREGSLEDHGKQSGDDDDLVRPWQVHRVLQGTAAPNCADTCTPLCTVWRWVDDALRDVQPVQFIAKDERQTSIKLQSSSNDLGRSVQDPLQLVSYSPRCVREHCVAVVYTTCHECMD